MPYALLTAPTLRLNLQRFPETHQEAVDILRGYPEAVSSDGAISISKWHEAQWQQPDGEAVDDDIQLSEWRFRAANGSCRLERFRTFDDCPNALSWDDVRCAMSAFLQCRSVRRLGTVLLENSEDTYATVFEARIALGLATVCASRRYQERLERMVLEAGYRLRK